MRLGNKALQWMLSCSSPGWWGREEETGSFHRNFSLLANEFLVHRCSVFFPKGMDTLSTASIAYSVFFPKGMGHTVNCINLSCSVSFPKGMDILSIVLTYHQNEYLFSTESQGSTRDLKRAVLRLTSLGVIWFLLLFLMVSSTWMVVSKNTKCFRIGIPRV